MAKSRSVIFYFPFLFTGVLLKRTLFLFAVFKLSNQKNNKNYLQQDSRNQNYKTAPVVFFPFYTDQAAIIGKGKNKILPV